MWWLKLQDWVGKILPWPPFSKSVLKAFSPAPPSQQNTLGQVWLVSVPRELMDPRGKHPQGNSGGNPYSQSPNHFIQSCIAGQGKELGRQDLILSAPSDAPGAKAPMSRVWFAAPALLDLQLEASLLPECLQCLILVSYAPQNCMDPTSLLTCSFGPQLAGHWWVQQKGQKQFPPEA